MNKVLMFCCLLFTVSLLHSQINNTQELIERFIQQHYLNENDWSFYAYSLTGQKEICNYNSSLVLKPASILKLVTTGVALIILDSNYRYQTFLQYDGKIIHHTLYGNLYIKGSGDPTFGSTQFDSSKSNIIFDSFYNALKKLKINKIKGSVLADASVFDSLFFPEYSWDNDDYGNYYGAGACGLTYHENYYTLSLCSGLKQEDTTTIIGIDPFIPHMHLKNNLRTSLKNEKENITIYGEPYNKFRTIEGTIPIDTSEVYVKGSIPNPALTCAWNFNNYLKSKNIGINNFQYKKGHGKVRKIILAHRSVCLKDIVQITNLQSNNTFAEDILKTIAVKQYIVGSTENGIKAIYKFFEDHHLSYQQLLMTDGSGLSQYNCLSTKCMVNFLSFMYSQPQFSSFYNSLPIAGRSGTLKTMFINTESENNLRAKTGSMTGVRCYSGYIKNQNNEMIVFCLMLNNINTSYAIMKLPIESLINSLTVTF